MPRLLFFIFADCNALTFFCFFLARCGWTSQRGSTVHRRYSEFVFLWDCLVRRYPFRLLPQLPPKRIGRT